MKTIYKSLMTIAFAGLCLASCDKELKEAIWDEFSAPAQDTLHRNFSFITA